MGTLQFKAIACDRDGTLVQDKTLAGPVRQALDRFKAAGGILILATGETVRQLAEFPDLDRFDLVVAENGALLYWPHERRSRLLTGSKSSDVVDLLLAAGVQADSVGEVIVSAKPPNTKRLIRIVSTLNDWAIIRNREEAMALPAGIDKGTGVSAALAELSLTRSELVGVGDAQNDVSLLRASEIGVTLASGMSIVQEVADLVLELEPGDVVVAVVERVLTGRLNKER